ncbi:MAG: hypothetical protein BWY95_02225 [Bacteroidetes bacterium ADurb.BinA104]|nr:MAG: hypothetical protein BWY95_02225 [Bacteroidetes bacterium ADurb.BinA104]
MIFSISVAPPLAVGLPLPRAVIILPVFGLVNVIVAIVPSPS